MALAALLAGCATSTGKTSLDQQFAGMAQCQLPEMYLNPLDGSLVGDYFVQRGLQPCKVADLAYFCVSDRYRGLPVSRIAIPHTGFSIHALFIDLDPETVRARLNWPELSGPETDAPELPKLVPDPDRPQVSVLYCEPHQEP
ncbi:MAG: hypothetical protein ACK4KV_19320 [Rhodocyclaceae bacterium]